MNILRRIANKTKYILKGLFFFLYFGRGIFNCHHGITTFGNRICIGIMLNLIEWRRVKLVIKKKQLLVRSSAGNTKMEPLLGISFPSFICHHCYFW